MKNANTTCGPKRWCDKGVMRRTPVNIGAVTPQALVLSRRVCGKSLHVCNSVLGAELAVGCNTANHDPTTPCDQFNNEAALSDELGALPKRSAAASHNVAKKVCAGNTLGAQDLSFFRVGTLDRMLRGTSQSTSFYI